MGRFREFRRADRAGDIEKYEDEQFGIIPVETRTKLLGALERQLEWLRDSVSTFHRVPAARKFSGCRMRSC